MAESKPIQPDDLFERGLFEKATKDAAKFAKELERSIEATKQLKDGFKLLAKDLDKGAQGLKVNDLESLKEANRIIAESAALKKAATAAEESLLKQMALAEKVQQQKNATAKSDIALRKAQADEAARLAKATEKEAEAQRKANSEYEKSKKQLNDVKKQLKELTITGKEGTAEFARLRAEFEKLDDVVRHAEESVGEFQRNVGNYPNAKEELRAIQKELVNLARAGKAGTDEFIKLSQQAGELKDAIKDANEASKAFASGSKFEQLTNQFGLIVDDLKNADFTGATEKLKTLSDTLGNINIKDLTAGFKDFGKSLLEVGKNVLSSPIFTLGAVFAGVAYAIYDVVAAYRVYNSTTETVTKSTQDFKKAIDELATSQAEYQLKIKVLKGQLTKDEADIQLIEIKGAQKRTEIARKFTEDKIKLAKELGITQKDIDLGVNYFMQKDNVTKLIRLTKYNEEVKKLQAQFIEEVKQQTRTMIAEERVITETAKAEAKKQEENKTQVKQQAQKIEKKTKETHTKDLSEHNRRAYEAELKQIKDALADQQAAKDKAAEDEEKKRQAAIKKREADTLAQYNKEKAEIEKADADKKKRQEDNKQFAINAAKEEADIISNLSKQASDQKIEALNQQEADAEKYYQQQQDLAARGLNNTAADERKARDKARMEKEKEKQEVIKRQKAITFFRLLASYADKGSPEQAVGKAAIQTALAEIVAGQFFEGTENVAESLGKPVFEGRDGYVIRVDGSERILTGDQNKRIGALTNDELAALADGYNKGQYLPGYVMETGKSTAENMAVNLQLYKLDELNNSIKSLERTIKEKPETSVKLDNLGDVITTRVQSGLKEIIKYKTPRI